MLPLLFRWRQEAALFSRSAASRLAEQRWQATALQKGKRNAPATALEVTGNAQPGAERKQYSMDAFGAQCAEVKVNPESGDAQVTRYVGAFAASRILNARTARSQCIGGIVTNFSTKRHGRTPGDTRRL